MADVSVQLEDPETKDRQYPKTLGSLVTMGSGNNLETEFTSLGTYLDALNKILVLRNYAPNYHLISNVVADFFTNYAADTIAPYSGVLFDTDEANLYTFDSYDPNTGVLVFNLYLIESLSNDIIYNKLLSARPDKPFDIYFRFKYNNTYPITNTAYLDMIVGTSATEPPSYYLMDPSLTIADSSGIYKIRKPINHYVNTSGSTTIEYFYFKVRLTALQRDEGIYGRRFIIE